MKAYNSNEKAAKGDGPGLILAPRVTVPGCKTSNNLSVSSGVAIDWHTDHVAQELRQGA
jgi:hypothetical protein